MTSESLDFDMLRKVFDETMRECAEGTYQPLTQEEREEIAELAAQGNGHQIPIITLIFIWMLMESPEPPRHVAGEPERENPLHAAWESLQEWREANRQHAGSFGWCQTPQDMQNASEEQREEFMLSVLRDSTNALEVKR